MRCPRPCDSSRSAGPRLLVLLRLTGTSIMNQAPGKNTVHLASKARSANPNHHLTNNNGTWWCQLTVHEGPFSRRLRFSLKTSEVAAARERRDRILARLASGIRPRQRPVPSETGAKNH